ncbi:PAQR family membrane homeostasis protein TrhA [Sulfurimonas sp. CS5]|uniref:PAQR family membrane homeostasis protein TrhA n=1 Tax=Sulfurimonas sp. CS5 TaxID=3391145 RepID=UPI0039EA0CE6
MAGLVILVAFASINGSIVAITSSAIFGTTLILMYGSSTLYHAVTHVKAKELFQKFDHASIYFLIAGSYTPITLVSLSGVWGYSLATAVWTTALFGIYMKFVYPNRFEKLSLFLYLIMGWSIVIAIKPLGEVMESGGIYLLIAGGLSYTLGVFFYVNDHKNFYHAIWHLFVLGGSIFHFFMTLFYII